MKKETQKKTKKENKTLQNLPNTKMNQEHDITALIYNGLRRDVVDTKQQANTLHDHVQKNTPDEDQIFVKSKRTDGFSHQTSYNTKIKAQCTAKIYKTYLKVIHQYEADELSIEQVVDQITELFHDHNPELLTEFSFCFYRKPLCK